VDHLDLAISAPSQNLVGLEKRREYVVEQRDIVRFRAAIDETFPSSSDLQQASEDGALGPVAPPLFCQVFTFEETALAELPQDGSPSELDIPGSGVRSVGGSSDYTIFRRAILHEKIIVRSSLKDIYAKRGRSGPLFFIVIETQFDGEDGAPIAIEKATYIRRPY
jgi:hypothetical protein